MNERSSVLDVDDFFIAGALKEAAERVRPEDGDKSFLEKRLANAVVDALRNGRFRPDLVVKDKKLVGSTLPGWDPQPGTIDVAVVTPEFEPRIIFELKIDDIHWTLWDIYKMVAGTQLPTVEAAYVVVAGPPKMWEGRRDCVELFDLDYDDEEFLSEAEWYSRFLFRHYARAWKELLEGGTGRLTEVPARIRISRVGKWQIPAYPPYELRAIRVEASQLQRGAAPVRFAGEWPGPPLPPPEPRYDFLPKLIPTESLTAEDLPAPDAEEDELHRFALSFIGYDELGSRRRCARIANHARERWLLSGELPTSLEELRGSLFFEQRRWHHYGDGFDEETMAYVRAVIEAIRAKLSSDMVAS